MSLNVPAGTRCFVDANILFYHFVAHPDFTSHVDLWFQRLVSGEFSAATTVPVIADALHRVMLSEVEMISGKPKGLSQIQKKPHIIASLRAYPHAVQSALLLPLETLAMEGELLTDVAAISSSCRLMTNDSFIVAVMRRNNIRHLVTNDDDFDHVPGIDIWKPR